MKANHDGKHLTASRIAAMRPGDTDLVDQGEHRGLRIGCGKSGVKTFYYRYRSPVTDRLVQVNIGHFPALSLAEARVQHHELKQARDDGRCPATERRQEKAEQQAVASKAAFTVKELVDFYLTQHIEDRVAGRKRIPGARKKKGQAEVRRTLYGDLVRVLGKNPAHEVTRKDIVQLVMDIVARGANVQAGNVLRETAAAYEYAIGLGALDEDFVNPALRAKSSLRQAKVKLSSTPGKRFLTDGELTRFLKWLPGSGFTATMKGVMHLTLLTGARTGEICNARWDHIDLEKGIWHVDQKTGVKRDVQLCRQAVEFLRQLQKMTNVWLFPSTKTGIPIQQKSLTEQSWVLRKSDRMLDIEHWTPHDLRRTVRTGLSRLGCPNEVGEAVLGHSRKGIEGTYDLHRYEPECRLWLQKWADHMDELLAK